jgi:diguanylate cyclase (GGDEF)-like protein
MERPQRSGELLATRWIPGLAFLAAVISGAYLLPPGIAGREVLLAVLLTGAPAAAMAGSLLAVRRLPGGTGSPWLLLCGGAAAALGAQVLLTSHPDAANAHVALTSLAMAILAVATGWILHQRDRGRALEIGLDAALVVAAAAVITLHLSPAARAILGNGVTDSVAAHLGAFVAPSAAGCAFLLAAILFLVRNESPAGAAAPALLASTAAFAVAVAPLAMGAGACCGPTDRSGIAWALGWVGLAYAGVRAAGGGGSQLPHGGWEAGGSRLRLVVAPSVALLMGVLLVDASLRQPLGQGTAVALGVLGMLLSARLAQLLLATRAQSVERMQLGHSRALVEVSHALSTTRDLEETLRLVTYWAVQLVHARGATIELLSDDGEWLEPRAGMGLPDDVLQLRFPVDHSFTGWVVRHGRARSTADASTDQLLHPLSRRHLQHAPVAAVPLRYAETTFGALTCVGSYPFSAEDLELLGAFAEQAAVAIETARLLQQVHQLSMTDPLTGLANRRQLEKDLAREFAAACRGRALVAVMFDLNGFKRFNDTEGHLMGDEALRLFGRALGAATRAMNMAARYGGDEFIALMADADARGAEIFIERVRERFPGPDAEPRFRNLTVAAGFAVFHPEMASAEELVAAADRALYADKAASAGSSGATSR